MAACGNITEYPSTIFARNLVTAMPAGMGKGFLTVPCPKGSACTNLQLPGGIKLPPHSIAVPLSSGPMALTALGPAPVAADGAEPQPTRRTVDQAAVFTAVGIADLILIEHY